MIFGCAGAAYGTAKSGIGIAGVGTFRPDLIMKVSQPLLLDISPDTCILFSPVGSVLRNYILLTTGLS